MKKRMSKEDLLELEGVVVEMLRGTKYLVKLDNGITINAHISGKLRMNKITIIEGDKVKVSVSPYDLTKGIITWRYK